LSSLCATLVADRRCLRPAAATASIRSVPSSSAIGDPGLDVEEQQLQAELALYDQQLERLHEQKSQRRSATPDQRAVTPGVSSGPAAATQQPSAADQQQGQVQVQAEQQPRAAQPEPQPEAAEAAAKRARLALRDALEGTSGSVRAGIHTASVRAGAASVIVTGHVTPAISGPARDRVSVTVAPETPPPAASLTVAVSVPVDL
jgi:DNA primase